MHKKFDNKQIEKKWQEKWQKDGLYDVGSRDVSKEKEYILVEWPYPSGNLHIGHWHAFAVPDIYVRFQRMNGKQVIYPMGFDAFGLPAENAAIKRNINPKEWTQSNIAYMKEQLRSMGASFSWDKTTSSTDEDYYKWTQWMFTEFFRNDIAYRGKGIVNWCPGCNTVVANEQVLADDTCERSGDQIEKREMPQWMLRITKYADRLIDDLESVEWPEQIKEAQRQWIGRSKGAELTFEIKIQNAQVKNESKKVKVFTTRPDTLFGVTYLVLAPEHELVEKNNNNITNYDEVSAYVHTTKQKAEQDRLDNTKEKTGVKLEGITAVNPANGEEIPVFIADYVLGGYGTGAIMGVPAHDERDFEFAKKFNLRITQVVESLSDLPIINTGILINSGEFDTMDSEEAKEAIVKKVGGKMTNTYRLRDWSVGRQRYWGVPVPIVYDPEGNAHPIPKEHLPWKLPEDVDFRPTGVPPLAKSEELKKRTEEIFGKGWIPEVETLDTFVDSSWYFLRYIDNHDSDSFSSLEVQKEWMPVDMYFGGAEHTTMHLLYSRFWQKALFDLALVQDSEPYKRRVNRGLILGPDGNKMSKSKGNVIDPDDHVQTVGADSVKMYLAFMGPYAETANYPWDMGGIAGIRRFLERAHGLKEHVQEKESLEMTKLIHKTIAKIRSDVPQYKFNTAISALMIYINAAEKQNISQSSYEIFMKLLAPFASHLSEELWEQDGHSKSIHLEAFPVEDTAFLIDQTATITVQINGKMRGNIEIGKELSETDIIEQIKQDSKINKYMPEKINKVIYVQGRIINLLG